VNELIGSDNFGDNDKLDVHEYL